MQDKIYILPRREPWEPRKTATHHLPTLLAPLIGRQEEVVAACRLLRRPQVLTTSAQASEPAQIHPQASVSTLLKRLMPAASASARTLPDLLDPLSERELEVLRLVAAGQSNDEVAQTLFVSVGTGKTHLKHIYGKLDVHTRTQAVARSRELGLLAL